MFVVVSYDIPDDRRRTKVMKLLKNYGTHVQYSVFDCDVKEQTYQQMRGRLEKLISGKDDSVRFYFLDEDAVKKVQVLGTGAVERARAFYVFG